MSPDIRRQQPLHDYGDRGWEHELVRRLVVMLGLVSAACSASFDPCAESDVIELVGPVPEQTWQQKFLFADADGYISFWGQWYALNAPEQSGVWAVRPAGSEVRLAGDVDAQFLAAMPVAAGFLLCWASGAESVGELRAGECFTVNAGLERVGTATRPNFGVITSIGETGDGRGALGWEDGTWRSILFAIDETGTPIGAPITSPCTWTLAMAWGPHGLACLQPSDPLCGTQFDEPPECFNDLYVYDLTGTQQLMVPGVAPFGRYAALVDARLAARADGYLVSWIDAQGWHARHIDPSGVPGTQVDGEEVLGNGSALYAVDTGYLAFWTSISGSYFLPRFMWLTPDGSPGGPPEWLAEPIGGFTYQYAASAVVANTSGGVAVAWDGAGGNDATAYVGAVRFRSLGCAAP